MRFSRPGLVLLRHATCTAPAGHCLGQWDLPLDSAGEQAAITLRRRWTGPLPRRVFCSDLARARQTADILLAGSGLRARVEPRLREISLGNWEGRDWDTLHRESPDQLAHWGRHWLDHGPPGGESGNNLFRRVREWYEQWRETQWREAERESTLVVAHAGSLRALACLMTGRGAEDLFNFSFEHCAPVEMLGRPTLSEALL